MYLLKVLILFAATFEFLQVAQCISQKTSRFGSKRIGEPCEVLDDCVGRWPEVDCSPQKMCVCAEGFIQTNGLSNCSKIVNEIGSVCEEPQQCQAGNLGPLSDCIQDKYGIKVCSCVESAVSQNHRSACLPKAKFVGDACEIQGQCLANLGASNCIGNKCVCQSIAVPSFDLTQCLPRFY